MRALLRYSRAENAGLRERRRSSSQRSLNLLFCVRAPIRTFVRICRCNLCTARTSEFGRDTQCASSRSPNSFQGKIETEAGECKEEKDSPLSFLLLLSKRERNQRKEREPAKDAPMTLFPPSATSLGALTLTAVVFLFPFVYIHAVWPHSARRTSWRRWPKTGATHPCRERWRYRLTLWTVRIIRPYGTT